MLAFLRIPLIAHVAGSDHGNADGLEAMAVFAGFEGPLAGYVEERDRVGMQAKGMIPSYAVAHSPCVVEGY